MPGKRQPDGKPRPNRTPPLPEESPFTIRALTAADRDWVRQKMAEEWGAEFIVVRGEIHYPADLPGFAAVATGDEAETIGLLTYRLEAEACEIMSLNSWRERAGVGSALIESVRREALERGCRRLYLVTTNDNTHALRFYQRQGFTLAAVRLNIMDAARRIKPQIPTLGEDGIPIRDEIELESWL